MEFMTQKQEMQYDKWEKDQNARLEANKKYQPLQKILNFMEDTKQVMDFVKEKSTALQRIKDIKFFHYPLDPINHIIWSMKTAGSTARRPALSKIENAPKAYISLRMPKTMQLTGIHKRIMIAIGALWDAGITEEIPVLDIWRMIGYKSNTSGGRDENLIQTIQSMADVKCSFNNNEEVDRGMATKHAQYTGPLLNVICRDMKITILEKPALLCFAEERNEYAIIPVEIFSTKIRLTGKTTTMENYLIERIYGRIRKDAQSITFKALWEKVTRNVIPWRIKRNPKLAKIQEEIRAGAKSWTEKDTEKETKMEWKEEIPVQNENEYIMVPEELKRFIKYQAEAVGMTPEDMVVAILERHRKKTMEKLKEIW